VTDEPTARDRFLALLIARVADDQFPSVTMMNEIERSLTPRMRDAYIQTLLHKLAQDRFPSPSMLKRVAALVR
jgi:hypothetical protein